MLYTRCPGCQTTFRITADTLRVANGAVRCGSCATVFSAYSGLRQDALDGGMRQDDELLSPTLQTQELARIEDLESPELADGGGEELRRAEAPDDAAREDDVAETPAEEAPAGEAISASPDASTESPFVVEPRGVAGAPPSLASLADDDTSRDPTAAASGDLHFETPIDEWAQLLSEIEESATPVAAGTTATASAPETPPGSDADGATARRRGAAHAGPLELWDVGEPFSFVVSGPAAEASATPLAVHDERPADAEVDGLSNTDESRARAAGGGGDQGRNLEPAISAEEVDATLSAEPAPGIAAELEAGLDWLASGSERRRLWSIGSVALLGLLGLQLAHHYRAALAAQPVVGALLRSTYSLLGAPISPAWDLGQYEILNWAATAGGNGARAGSLRITAQIRNSGPSAQPYPDIRLELKDRWDAVIGSRIFAPAEWLKPGTDAGAPMAAGAIVPADLEVVDPGLDASGFELDVCLESGAGRMRCAADRVFERP